MAGGLRAFIGFIFQLLRSFAADHLRAIGQLLTFGFIDNLIVLIKRLAVIWPSVLSLILGVLLLTLSQVADLLARPLDAVELVVLAVCLLFFWIIPLHLGARILLNARLKRLAGPDQQADRLDEWLPKDLGFLAILALAVAIRTQTREFAVLAPHFEQRALHAPSGLLWIVPIAVLLAYVVYLAIRERTNETMSEDRGRRLSMTFAGISALLVLAASMAPFQLAELFGGLLFVPMLVGGWIMPIVALTMLLKAGVAWRRFVQFGAFAVVAALIFANAYSSNPFHDIRLMSEEALRPRATAQLDLESAISQWKDVNKCNEEEAQGRRCKAVLVTAEGGASRAAFQVATVMGELLDRQPTEDFRNRLFLFSGVSGGSLGLGTVRQALFDSAEGGPPCKSDFGRSGRHWIFYASDSAKDVTKSWRKCLQLLVSADYLTPAVVGLVLRDWWMALPAMFDLGFNDRSALLERAMERHYAAITGKDCDKFEGLCSAFGHVDRTKRWLPALTLNSTLVERGQNVVASDIDPSSSFPAEQTCLNNARRTYPAHLVYSDTMPGSYDIFELMDAKPNNSQVAMERPKVIRDIRMSTAIVASAKFPVISSRGNVRDGNGELVGQLVDGGYFDNSGLTSILDIIDALDCHNVDSIVISIRNNPLDENASRLWRFPGRENIRQPSLERSEQRINIALSPVQAFMNSSEGHVLANRLATMNRVGYSSFIFSNIYKVICVGKASPDGACLDGRVPLTSVSMSWWLSSNVQLFIEMQDRDKLLGLACGQTHCRFKAADLLSGALEPTVETPPDTATQVDPGVIGLESGDAMRRYAQ